MEKNHNRKGSVEKELFGFSQSTVEDVYEELKSTEDGLDPIEASSRLEMYGKNIIETDNNKQLLQRIKESVINPFNVVLIAVIIITIFTDIIFASEKSYATVIVLILIVITSSTISFTQTEKYNNAAKKLRSLISNKVDVIRNDVESEISIEDLVPGDIIKLGSGDMIPADVRFIQTKDLFIDQAQLTGESNPVEKYVTTQETKNLLDLDNIGFTGSNVVSGSARAIVLTTGNQTYFGTMAKSLYTEEEKSKFEKDTDEISKLLIRFMIIMVPVVFIVNLFTKNDAFTSLMFGITIAVGLMPEMLPVILTSSLAKGALEMSKKQTIVKRLSAIQTFGEIDVLCTDKTGTLTEDEIVLEKYLDVTGKEDQRILRHAFLNSYFQTGLKNLMDLAIINRAEQEGLSYLKGDYIKEDEIPFDFERRRMSVVLKDLNGKRQLITKGAVDEIMSICKYIELDGNVVEMTEELRNKAYHVYEENNNDGLRVIAVAQKNEVHDVETFGIQDESDMVLIGFVGFLDPPKESAKAAIEALSVHGIRTVVLTGDSQGVAVNVCNKIGIHTDSVITGADIDAMTDEQLQEVCRTCDIFAKLNPFQKKRIVAAFQANGHSVGYMGDGINDAPPLKQADVGISVDTAVDIAKEVADIILLQKDLGILEEGVVEGRKTFANMIKYLKMAISGNFGNMFSVVIASIFLPFLPLEPIHILVQNLLNDFAQLGMPFDKVEEEYIRQPRKFDIDEIKVFMVCFGLLSTVIDILCFIILWFVFGYNSVEYEEYFQCGWFMLGIISQTFIIHILRTHKIPFIQATASRQLNLSTISIVCITVLIGFTPVASVFHLAQMPIRYALWLVIMMIVYLVLAQIMKKIYRHVYHGWIFSEKTE